MDCSKVPAKGKGRGGLSWRPHGSLEPGWAPGWLLGALLQAWGTTQSSWGLGSLFAFFLLWDDAGLFRSASPPSRDGTRTGTCRGLLVPKAVLLGWMLF